MHRIDRKKVLIGFGVLIVALLVWPFIISTVVVNPKINSQKEALSIKGMELKVEEKKGYFSSQREYSLTVNDKEKFLTFLSGAVKIDKTLLESIMPENDDVLGLKFSGNIATKIWQPLSVSVYIEPNDFPKNQIKLLELKELLKKFGAAFVFNLRGKLKEIDFNNIDIKSEEVGTNMALNFIKPIIKLGDVNKFSLEKYLLQTASEDKNVGIISNNAEYNFQYKDDYNFKFTSNADDFLYYTKYNFNNPDDYTVFLAKKISEETAECKNILCIKTIANEILENEKHIDSFEIYLNSRIIDGIKYNSLGNKTFEVRHSNTERNLEYRIIYTKDNFKLANVELKGKKNSSNIDVFSDSNDVSIKTNTKVDDFLLHTANYNIDAKIADIHASLTNVKLAPIKYIMDNTEQFSSWELDGFSPLLKHIIEIANYGGEMNYGMEFSDLKFSKMKFLIKELKLDANFVLKENNYNILNKSAELLNYITFTMNIKVDKESFEKYLKSPMNEYKNLDKVVKYDGDYALLDVNFNLKDDVILANNKELIK
jgi:hypothetical protein